MTIDERLERLKQRHEVLLRRIQRLLLQSQGRDQQLSEIARLCGRMKKSIS